VTDIDILADFFLVDHVAERMGWIVNPALAGESVRALQALARDEQADPADIMRAVQQIQIAIGGVNLAAVVAHDLWEDWCPQPAGIDPLDYDNGSGVILWAGKRGYVKMADDTGDTDNTLSLSAVRL
jgi:hypothetical protein